MKQWMRQQWRENRSFFAFVFLMFVFRSAVADWNEVPTGSMNPTIVEGDRILVNKLAYDVNVPFTHVSLFKIGDPQRGDIIVFDSNAAGKRLVKRVVGLPGDRVELRNNQLFINDINIAYATLTNGSVTSDKVEDLFGVKHIIRVKNDGSRLSSFTAITVPNGCYLALGDNRDNSADSRVIGFIPRHEIVGSSKRVVVSFNYDNYYIPRADRYLRSL